MGRFKRGWILSKQSWAVVKADKSLLAFPIISTVAAIITMIIFFGGGAAMAVAFGSAWGALPLVVIGAPLAVDADAFRTADGNLEGTLRIICERVHGYGDVPVGKFSR
jgi:hypothetical protein